MLPTIEHIDVTLSKIKHVAQEHNGKLSILEVKPINSGPECEMFDVAIKLEGACSTCAISEFTVRYGVERTLREFYPGFRQVVLSS